MQYSIVKKYILNFSLFIHVHVVSDTWQIQYTVRVCDCLFFSSLKFIPYEQDCVVSFDAFFSYI